MDHIGPELRQDARAEQPSLIAQIDYSIRRQHGPKASFRSRDVKPGSLDSHLHDDRPGLRGCDR